MAFRMVKEASLMLQIIMGIYEDVLKAWKFGELGLHLVYGFLSIDDTFGFVHDYIFWI